MMQAGAVEGGNWATVDHAVIRGLVTARPWCVAGLPLSLCRKSRSSRGIEDCPDRPALRRACRMVIGVFGQPLEW